MTTRASQNGIPGAFPMASVGAPAQPPTPTASPAPTAAVVPVAVVPVAAAPEGDDTKWLTRFGSTSVGNRPYAAAVTGDVVYVGGDFTSVMAGMPTGTYNRIAQWDGRGWQRLGDGVDSTVHAICVVGEDVYVGGEFSIAGQAAANRLARWSGGRWHAVGGGVAYADQPWMATVRGIVSDGRRLFVTGIFDRVGSGATAVAASGIAAFDLTTHTWEALGSGLVNVGSAGEGRALALHDGRLYVGGFFDTAGPLQTASLASIDTATSEWTGYGTGIRDGDYTASVDALAVDESTGRVYVGGSFTRADSVPASGVVLLDNGTFTSPGEFTRFGSANTASVKALALSAGILYAGGEFTAAGNAAASNWAAYDGTSWTVPAAVDNVVRALEPIGDGVVVLGDFVFSGSLRVPYGGIWTGTGWESFGQGLSYDPYADANVYAVSATDTGVYVGGYFDQAGAVPVGSVARWTGTAWDALAGGLKGVNALATVYGMAQLGADLYVTGTFASAGRGAVANIARWDGSTWSAVGSGINGTGYALTVLGGRLYVGGSFTAAGAATASGVACWDPATGSWAALGNAPVFDHAVQGLAVLANRYLVIGGQFDAFRSANTDLVRGLNGLVMFDTQEAIPPGDLLAGYYVVAGVEQSRGPGTVRALQVLGGDLFVGGTFDTAGVLETTTPKETGFAAQNLAVWHFGTDGSWSTPGGADQPVQAFSTLDAATLLVGGWFRAAGPVAASGVASYDPATGAWASLGSGLGEGGRGAMHVEALAQSREAGLWVGGSFATAGGAPSGSIALWTGTAGRPG